MKHLCILNEDKGFGGVWGFVDVKICSRFCELFVFLCLEGNYCGVGTLCPPPRQIGLRTCFFSIGLFEIYALIKRQCDKRKVFKVSLYSFWSISLYKMKTRVFGGVGDVGGEICSHFLEFFVFLYLEGNYCLMGTLCSPQANRVNRGENFKPASVNSSNKYYER